ncbi:sigma-70 family RNA polymerase sigma factor [Solibacillus sp. MA9]|uniref:Sigma-70 family RNA polymerase sigma factor n=1 Tax=Solibacillus palustris TaxID=2908203 RepID=A0ABS9UFI2_9BACL|nr:sigma-70 family RNA polymerase sigma factor [Solibacillus sp. MA9]MCH7323104.1 sigma-70 family RNA polymerase sigma factor [Solibacillus sp. MA9]
MMDEPLLQRAINGEHHAILQLIEFDEEILYCTAFAYVKNEHDALDAMQELTYKALKKMHTINQPTYARTWLMRVLINCCIDILRKKQQSSPLSEEPASFDKYESDIQSILQTLTLSEQQLIYLKFFDQLKNKEIAAVVNLAEGTVKSKIHYILKKLRNNAGERSDWL